ncbi:hypothetical protein [Gottfriedia acidiceleris]|nr:hypothetical protein [Gottfriedia acidiceleris]
MTKDVNEAFITIIKNEGAMIYAAEAYLKVMQKQGRYQRDVYEYKKVL